MTEGDVATMETTRSAARAATQSTEVRWFVPGDGPPLDGAPMRSRTDSYSCEMLADGASIKSRVGHRAGISLKLRSAVLASVTIGDLHGVPETWLRYELASLPPSVGALLDVHKRIAKRRGIEIVQLEFCGAEWWSVAVRLHSSGLPDVPRRIRSHLGHHHDDALCCSYPTWLRLQAETR